MRKHFKELKSISMANLNIWLADQVQALLPLQGASSKPAVRVQFIHDALAFYRSYFGIPTVGDHFIGRPVFLAGGKIKPGKAKGDFVKHSYGNYTPTISDLHLYKHFLSATQAIHNDLLIWIHLCIKPTTNFLIIDRDYHKDAQYSDEEIGALIAKDYAYLVSLFGEPSLVVTSRSGGPGCNYHFKLDKEYPNEFVKAYVASKGLVESTGEWDIFPRGINSAYTALPFGMNSKLVINGVIQPELGLVALLKWYTIAPSASVLDLSGFTLPTPIVTQVPQTETRQTSTAMPAVYSVGDLAGKSLSDIKELISELFAKPKLFKRNYAQQLLKYHTQVLNDMSVPASINFAWNWMEKNLDSKDIRDNKEWAYSNLADFYKKRWSSNIKTEINYELGASQIRLILKDLMDNHSIICDLTKGGERQNKSIFAVYSLYLFLHAEHHRQKIGSESFQIRTASMKNWPGCSEARYKKAVVVLEGLNLVKIEKGYIETKNGKTRNSGNYITLQGKPVVPSDLIVKLDAIEPLFLKGLPQFICHDIFGVAGYAKRVQKLKLSSLQQKIA